MVRLHFLSRHVGSPWPRGRPLRWDQTVIVFWSMVAGAGIMLVGVIFGVVIADVSSKKTPKEEQ